MNYSVWLGSAALATSIPLLWWSFQGDRNINTRAVKNNLRTTAPAGYRGAVLDRPAAERILDPVLRRLARVALRFFPSTWFDRLDERLAKAGLLGRFRPEQVVGAKMLLAIVLSLWLGASALADPTAATVGIFAVGVSLAWFLPDLLLASRGDRRVETVNRELPDILDQLTVSVEAGLGFEAAMARIGDRDRGQLPGEFARSLQDIRLGVSRLEALQGLSERTKSEDVHSLVLALRQSENMGVPLAKTLRTQSDGLRVKRRLRAEEAAYKLPVKMIFPLGLCILPALFIVVLGPAFIQISEVFS